MYPPSFTLCLFCNIGSQKFISIPSIIQSYNLIYFFLQCSCWARIQRGEFDSQTGDGSDPEELPPETGPQVSGGSDNSRDS